MAEENNNPHQTTIHVYRGVPELHAWSHYKKLDRHWAVCGYQREGIGGIPGSDSLEISDHKATIDPYQADCPFCLDLIERTQRRQTRVVPRCKSLPDGEVEPFDPVLMVRNSAIKDSRRR